jgi:dihydroorotase
VIDPDRRVTIDASRHVSKSKNTPFNGWELRGAVAYTLVGGRIVHRSA